MTGPEAVGHLTLAPARAGLPLASNLNIAAGETTANPAIVAVTGAALQYLSSARTDVVLGVSGYWTPAGGPVTGGRYSTVYRTRDPTVTKPKTVGHLTAYPAGYCAFPG